MRECTPADFIRRWPTGLFPIVLPFPTPSLPGDCCYLLITFGLPKEITIYCHNDVTIKFSGKVAPLSEIWDRDLRQHFKLGTMPSEWFRYWHLADVEYTQGGGWICVDQVSGSLVDIDLDIDDNPILLIGSSLRSFYTILAHLLDWSETHPESKRAEIAELHEDLLQQKCVSLAELDPFWVNIVYTQLDSDPFRFHLELGPHRENA